jgi:hypothetical protein
MSPRATKAWRLAAALGAGLACLAPAHGQTPASDPSAALHAAWLKEVMDLDVVGAVRDYEAIAANPRPSNPERWVAVARLAELQRLGIVGAAPVATAEAPSALRSVLLGLHPPLPVEELQRRVSRPPAEVVQLVGTDAGRLPPLRPATPSAQAWLRDQIGPSVDDRLRQLVPPNRTRTDPARAERWQAADILNVELQGRQDQAAKLRQLYFGNWKPPVVGTDHAATLQRVASSLEAWLKELKEKDNDNTQQQQMLLRGLREAVEQRAAIDQATAVAFVLRMPYYADRLLGAVTSPR